MIMRSEPYFGEGDPSDLVPDIKLTPYADLAVYGRNKWYLESKACLNAPTPCAFNVSLPSTASATAGASTTLTANCSGDGCSGVTYSWTGPGSNGNGLSTTFTATTSGTYTITASKQGCTTQTKSLDLTVTDCGYTLSASTNDSPPYITNSPITLSYNCTGTGCTGVSYAWSQNGASGNASPYTLNMPSAPGNYQYTITGTKNGCSVQTAVVSIAVTSPPPGGECFSLRLASSTVNLRRLANVNGVVKVKDPVNTGYSQTWKLQESGSYYKIIAQDGTDRVLGVQNGGSSTGDIITLQNFSNQDHQLWEKIQIENSSQGYRYGFKRKNAQMIMRSEPAFGEGDPSDAITDIKLTPYADLTVYGRNKWYMESKACLNAPTPCAFNVSLPLTASATAGASTTLTATCSGDGCSGVTYSWTGPGSNGNGLSTTFTAPATPGSYTYTLTATKEGCTTQTKSLDLTVNPPVATCAGSGTGLTGKYFNSIDLSNAPVLIRVDATINFPWGSGSPDPNFVNSDFSVRWEGEVEAPVSGSYTFKTNNDDGTRVWIEGLNNGNPIIDDWNPHGVLPIYGTPVSLTACTKYKIKIEFYDLTGDAQSQLYWLYPGQTEQIVPQSRLYPLAGPVCTTPPQPTVGANPGSITSGATATLSASNCDGALTWAHGSSLAVSPTSTTTYTATCTVAGGCSNSASVMVTVNGNSQGFSQCIEAENSNGNGPVTTDPNASNGNTRGAESNFNHYVDYVVTNVPSAGSYNVNLQYYSSSAPVVNVQVNGGSTQTVNLANSLSWNIVWAVQSFSVSLVPGTNTIRIQGTGGGSCRQDKICVTGSGGGGVCSTPAPPNVSAGSTITQGASAQLSATGCSGGSIVWSDGITGDHFVSPNSTTTYNATCVVGTCASSANSVTITVNVPPNPSDCYEIYNASHGKRMTNNNGIVEMKDADNSNSQRWKFEESGGYLKIRSMGGTNSTNVNNILGVRNQGFSASDFIDLQSDASQPHQLWLKTELTANSGLYKFERKDTGFRISSFAYGYGAGYPGDGIPDLTLASDVNNEVGANKWILGTKPCPTTCSTTITATPSRDSWISSTSGEAVTNFGSTGLLLASAWVYDSVGVGIHRSVLDFSELRNIPQNAIIESATLFLYGPGDEDGWPMGNYDNEGTNQLWVERVTSAWEENYITWLNRPSFTEANRVSIPGSTSEWEHDVSLNVQQLVQDMVNLNSSDRNGFQLRLQQEQVFRSFAFLSRETNHTDYRPKLQVTYRSCPAN
ncbi:PA14 domain-containing protein [Dyadobacter sp. 32]|uniref:PA14 domain-containing protein n=1 Tax=Dyadobacter sp. 32 TaxID=538966 RepID=UPI0011EF96C2